MSVQVIAPTAAEPSQRPTQARRPRTLGAKGPAQEPGPPTREWVRQAVRRAVECLPSDVTAEQKERFVDYLETHPGYKPPTELKKGTLRRHFIRFQKHMGLTARKCGRPRKDSEGVREPLPRVTKDIANRQIADHAQATVRDIQESEIAALARRARHCDGENVRVGTSLLCTRQGPYKKDGAEKQRFAGRRRQLRELWPGASVRKRGIKRGSDTNGRFRGLIAKRDLREGTLLAYVGRVVWQSQPAKKGGSDDGPDGEAAETQYTLEDKHTDWKKLTQDKQKVRRFIVPLRQCRPLASYANHAFSSARRQNEELLAEAQEMGLDTIAEANAEFTSATLEDAHLGQFPSLRLMRELKAGDEILVDYGASWKDVFPEQDVSGGAAERRSGGAAERRSG